MSYWDTSALVKLSVAESDSADFRQIAATTARTVTASIARLEARTVFRRLEAEGTLPAGEAAALSADLNRDVALGRLVVQVMDADVEREFVMVLEACFSSTPPIFIRTNDALHVASAVVAGEVEFITADSRQRAAAQLMGLTVRP
ncbi:MAG TPA: type II toxin-antitoxin system VapC family toxin [Chthoniobacteraceae bacterium]|jgi:predicted nucleic acid-binding protein|nr:type II toxin-antitoxin system VapC family toxin [Chthoniobacteraceae bacterium]